MKLKNIKAGLIIAIVLPAFCFGQIPKGTNAIKVSGVSFNQVVNNLLDSGFLIDKIESNFQTLETKAFTKHDIGFLQIANNDYR